MFKIQYLFYAILVTLFLTGCANTSTEDDVSNEQPVQPIHYEDNRNQPVSEEDPEEHVEPPSLASFDREESAAFQELIREHAEVEDAQVVTEADRVVVAVQMKIGTDQRDFEEISEDIEQILNTEKKLYIYNNKAKWERVKDFYARDEADQMDKEMERLFQNLFE
ncbi:YhcN/YlaJ family sporulation lipoprotein [Oceanobacillus sp. CFH 90083]|uniref:YhcN/YlaJ family sporulation lipoprotein n=1 Tax=Oceanobacillus sp. CFH 90083 TaxID=2592336 RepID=UPI00188454D6|nr:YhcN/YlaJ family sporulation lipoprotein [Oceanobacillus sp. CFH 90083]